MHKWDTNPSDLQLVLKKMSKTPNVYSSSNSKERVKQTHFRYHNNSDLLYYSFIKSDKILTFQ